jgi:hypothetical protein
MNVDLFKIKYKKDKRRKKLRCLLKKHSMYVLSQNSAPTFKSHMGHTSHLDMFITNNIDLAHEDHIAAIIHPEVPLNTSTHVPVSISINISHARRARTKRTISSKLHIDWPTLDKLKYDNTLEQNLEICDWTSMNQKQCLNKITTSLHEATHLSAETRLVKTVLGIRRKKWDPEIKAATLNCKNAHRALTAAKESKNNDQIEALTALNKKCKKEVRKAQRQASAKARDRLLRDISDAALTDAKKFNRLLNFNKSQKDLPPILINEKLIYDEATCTEHWAEYHRNLATPKEMPNMDDKHLSFVQNNVKEIREHLRHDKSKLNIAIADIRKSILKLNNGKSADDDGIYAEHVKKAPCTPHILLKLYEKISEDESIDKALKTLLKISAPKKHKEDHIQSNYRGIAISKLILKILEHILHDKSKIEESTHNLQFGFTKGRGPDMAALCLTEAINEAADLNKTIYIVSLDTMKAFDMVNHDILLYRLYHLGIAPPIWKLFDSLLQDQSERAIWGSCISRPYPIRQGTGQGKITGAPLFKVFINPLLDQLSSIDLGFRIGNIPMGHPTCADDLLLIADSVSKVQSMCDTVEICSRQDRATQQASKSKAACNKRNVVPEVTLENKKIPHDPFYTHVGINRYTSTNNQLIQDRISTLTKTAYGLMPAGFHGTTGLSPFYTRKVIISHVRPRTIHGIHALVLSKTQRATLDSAYTHLIKSLQSLPKRTSSAAALLIYGVLPISAELDKRELGLYGSICTMTEDDTLNQLAHRQMATKTLSSRSWFIHVYKLGLKYGIDTIAALDLAWTKAEWKRYVKQAVLSYHKYHMKLEALSKVSLSNMIISFATMSKGHSIWPQKIDGRLDRIHVKAACYRAKMLTSTYMLTSITCKFDSTISSPKCLLCNTEDETITHFLCICPELKAVRKRDTRYLYHLLIAHDIPLPTTNFEKVTLILNGHETNQKINRACSNICYSLHRKRHEILQEKGLDFKNRKKKVAKEFDPLNACINCTKEVKNDHKAIQCELCDLWQHIKCENIMSGWRYNRIMKGRDSITWVCKPCKRQMLMLTDRRIELASCH